MVWLITGILGVIFIVVWILQRNNTQINQQLNSLNQQISQQINSLNQQIEGRLNETSQALRDTNKTVGERLDSATRVFGEVQKNLGSLSETSKHILEYSKDFTSLQQLLRAPKFRGEMGELMLENLLSQMLPKDNYRMQYRFKSNEAVDAVIKLGGRIVPIDAKFSLENFKRMLEEQEEQRKNTYRKKFVSDVKMRIDKVASKYILPTENTYDFAFMYIPAENVYYEIIIKENLFPYFVSKKVFPVSPNTFYAYLQVIILGLRGLEIEENAKSILKGLSALSIEMGKFKEDFDVLGNHLSNANNRYSDSQRRLDRFLDKLSNIQENKQIEGK